MDTSVSLPGLADSVTNLSKTLGCDSTHGRSDRGFHCARLNSMTMQGLTTYAKLGQAPGRGRPERIESLSHYQGDEGQPEEQHLNRQRRRRRGGQGYAPFHGRPRRMAIKGAVGEPQSAKFVRLTKPGR